MFHCSFKFMELTHGLWHGRTSCNLAGNIQVIFKKSSPTELKLTPSVAHFKMFLTLEWIWRRDTSCQIVLNKFDIIRNLNVPTKSITNIQLVNTAIVDNDSANRKFLEYVAMVWFLQSRHCEWPNYNSDSEVPAKKCHFWWGFWTKEQTKSL